MALPIGVLAFEATTGWAVTYAVGLFVGGILVARITQESVDKTTALKAAAAERAEEEKMKAIVEATVASLKKTGG